MYSTIRWLTIFCLLFTAGSSVGATGKALDFSLMNWDGQTITMDDMAGRVVILTFSYSFCSTSCPVITGRLLTLDETMNSPTDVAYLHISIDPEMDTPERRKDYFSLYGIDASEDRRWIFVSGGRQELQRLWEFYGIVIEKVQSPFLPEGYFMEYSPKVMIIDKKGYLAHETNFYFNEDETARKIGNLQ